jgi:fatty acid synthase subunit alpha
MSATADKVPLLHLKHKAGTNWEYSSNLTGAYLYILHEITTSGMTSKDKNALLIGIGGGSIGVEVVMGLLPGGAQVPPRPQVTTARMLNILPVTLPNLWQPRPTQVASALVDYIYANLDMNLDCIIPLAENGHEIDGLDDRSELVRCMMLVNLLRILGTVKTKKANRHFFTPKSSFHSPRTAAYWEMMACILITISR